MALPDEVQREPDERRMRRLIASGIAARTAGVPRHKCPLCPGSEASVLWLQGWDERDDQLSK